MRLRSILGGGAAVVLAGLAGAATGQTLPSAEHVRGGMFDASDPSAIVRFMETAGYRAALTSDAYGDPLIRGRLSRTDYVVNFYECEDGAFCNSLQLMAEGASPAGVEQVNAFNQRWRYVRASLADGRVRLQMDVNLDSGVTADNLADTLDIWRQLLEVFERELLGSY